MKKLLIMKSTLLISLITLVNGCSSANLSSNETIMGQWKIFAIQEVQTLNKSTVTIEFNEENKVSGSASCNNFSSQYSKDNNSLTIASVATTRKMCPPILMTQESKMLSTLTKVRRYQLINGLLTMYDQKGTVQIEAKRINK